MITASEGRVVAQQNALTGFMPYLELEIERQKATLSAQATSAVRAGTLTPELAVSLWQQWVLLGGILKGFETRVRVGTAVGERHKDALTAGMPA